ncbi:Dps family protein [Leucobacter tenebrionis]|uniref:Dps family protein n=1 Tax=Leucobacter tenebrionis TaxID=2873270 RepID=UPI001CA74495|nr:DNA starvation/stationary phase protection protein [Leucobacter tenebrionis]QZY53550.1 DNA starvation/stationary phase protection protein [Leucobacter tenebrionis]
MVQTKKQSVVVAKQDIDRAAGVEHYLAPVVHDLVALAVDGKQAHWHVRGANFIGVHEFLDEVVEHAQDGADEVAERIVALGLPVDARIGTVAKKASLPEAKQGFQQSDDTIRDVVSQLDAALVTIYAAISGLEDIDPTSQDIVIALAQQLDKDRWFLASHLTV